MAGGHYTFGTPQDYDKFVDKYLALAGDAKLKHLEAEHQKTVVEWAKVGNQAH